jgi:hypothetical protein
MLRARKGTTPRCPFCHDGIERGSPERARCRLCRTLHHADCFVENGKCTALGCGSSSFVGVRPVPPSPPYRAVGAAVALVLHVMVLAALPLYVPIGCRVSGGYAWSFVTSQRPPHPTIDSGSPRAIVTPDDTFAEVCAIASSSVFLDDEGP